MNEFFLKSIGLSCIVKGFFIHACDMVTSCIGNLENIGSLGYAALPVVSTVHDTISKNPLVKYYYPSE